ncbi:hypothetical protein PQR72_27850 [Paraburkholderia madseniana]|uniref:hypothetical protein n=1 Tax=Paraburkholderia madseniana TaxID=2599607 RepID=UPI0015C54107|nr:hypothetical protein [Paraburkholderia madseniana]NPT69128.1 hypothetical protein [Paraburkholderia madseniana]
MSDTKVRARVAPIAPAADTSPSSEAVTGARRSRRSALSGALGKLAQSVSCFRPSAATGPATKPRPRVTLGQLLEVAREQDSPLARFAEKQKIARQQELKDMQQSAKNKDHETEKDVPLAAYVLARTVLGQPTEDRDLRRLQKGNETVNRTREHLKYGAGNIIDDIQRTGHESTHRVEAGRWVMTKLAKTTTGHAKANPAAAAIFTQAGNCGEHAILATHLHAGKLDEDETVHTLKSARTDHAWAESRVGKKDNDAEQPAAGDRQPTVVMDAWSRGPAIFAEDGRFTKTRGTADAVISYDQKTGKQALDVVKRRAAGLETSEQKSGLFRTIVKGLQDANFRAPEKNLYRPTPVIDDAFSKVAAARMNALASMRPLVPKKTRGRIAQALGKKSKAPPSDVKKDLRDEIKAVGAARSLGSGVKSATGMASEIVDTVKKG